MKNTILGILRKIGPGKHRPEGGPFRQELYKSIQQQVEAVTMVGQAVPPLAVHDHRGESFELEQLWQDHPALIVTGSLSCGQTRRWMPELKRLHDTFHPNPAVVLLYTLEPHPVDVASPYTGAVWKTRKNSAAGIACQQPRTLAARIALANDLASRFELKIPILIDNMENQAWDALGHGPNVAVLIGRDGVVLEKQGWFNPQEMQRAMQKFALPSVAR